MLKRGQNIVAELALTVSRGLGWGRRHPGWVMSFCVTVLVLLLRLGGAFQWAELQAWDAMVRAQPTKAPHPDLLVVGITEADLRDEGGFPLSDQTFAELISILQQSQPLAIGLDVYREIDYPPGSEALKQAFQSPNLFFVESLGMSDHDAIPAPAGVKPEQVGFNDLVIDPDGVLRRNLLYAAVEEDRFYSFALRLSLERLAKENIDFEATYDALKLGNTQIKPLEPTSGGYQSIDAAGYQIMLQYRSADQVARQVSLSQVLQGKVDPAWIKDKIVLIGQTAPSVKDFFYTPYSVTREESHVMSGVVVHAQMVAQILEAVLAQKPLPWFLTQWQEALWIAIWALLGGFIVERWQHPVVQAWAVLGSLLTLLLLWSLFMLGAGWLPLVPAGLALGLTTASTATYQVFYRTFYDPITGLPNRALFLKQTQAQIKRGKRLQNTLAVVFVDIDDFKVVNESLGHRRGDQLLRLIARKLKAYFPKAQVARVGGDDFAILLNHIDVEHGATSIADDLQKQLSAPMQLGQQPLVTTASVGIALHQGGYDYLAEDLLQDAHRAMYRAKVLGKDRYAVFAEGMRVQAISRFHMEMDLRRALEQQELSLAYQPIISLQEGRISGFESLLRWSHPQRGWVSPADFIPVAEESGLIIPIGQWLTRTACQQMQQWHELFPQQSPLFISVNLSSRQFMQSDLVEQMAMALKETGLTPQGLKLELTESAAMEDVESAIEQLLRLKDLGIQLSLDDFGTGYSSLSYLHRLPIDTLKVDKSFVGRMEYVTEDSDIVSTIVALGHKLGIQVIAEGVETAIQLSQLRGLGCDYGQGYFFSKPIHAPMAQELLAKAPTW
jgi:diguanylate cyclase (GGDEF)-like protein